MSHQPTTPDHSHPKDVTIVVNGRQKSVAGKEITYEQVIALAFDPPPSGENVCVTVTYRRGEGNKPEGTLVSGQSVKLKEGMIFNVAVTDKS